MFTKEDHEFIDFLFGKLTSLTDTEMIDLHDDDSCCDHLNFQQLELFYAPNRNGNVNMEEFDFVDFWNSEVDVEELEKIQSTLIDMMQCVGLYFMAPVPV